MLETSMISNKSMPVDREVTKYAREHFAHFI